LDYPDGQPGDQANDDPDLEVVQPAHRHPVRAWTRTA
jgi:hypothetical protein